MIDRDDTRITRRGFFWGIGVSAVSLIGLTAGQASGWLSPINLFAPRQQGEGPQSLPVNRTAEQAGVVELAMDPGWRLTVMNGAHGRAFSRAALQRMEQTEVELPIACVEGWSTLARWGGVRVGELLAAVGAPITSTLRITSFEPHGYYRTSMMGPEYIRDPATLVALELNGEPLDVQHGFPARVIAPGRPGVLQTKWLSMIEVIR